jgi:glutaredoxin
MPHQPVSVVVYTRRGCHLCEDAWTVLASAQEHFNLQLEKVDIDANADLAALHGDCVPVVLVNGKVRFRGKVNPVLLARLLRGERARPTRPNGNRRQSHPG